MAVSVFVAEDGKAMQVFQDLPQSARGFDIGGCAPNETAPAPQLPHVPLVLGARMRQAETA